MSSKEGYVTPTKTEPVALGALVQIALNAVLTLLVAFNVVTLTGEQTAALYGVANVVVTIVVAVKARSVVYSPYTVQEAMKPSPEDLHA